MTSLFPIYLLSLKAFFGQLCRGCHKKLKARNFFLPQNVARFSNVSVALLRNKNGNPGDKTAVDSVQKEGRRRKISSDFLRKPGEWLFLGVKIESVRSRGISAFRGRF